MKDPKTCTLWPAKKIEKGNFVICYPGFYSSVTSSGKIFRSRECFCFDNNTQGITQRRRISECCVLLCLWHFSTHDSQINHPALYIFKGCTLSEYIYNLKTPKLESMGQFQFFPRLFQLVQIMSANIIKKQLWATSDIEG